MGADPGVQKRAGHLHEITKELGLDRYTGWWRGVTTGDIDGDGRLDIIASNWGLNSDYQASSNQPVRLYYGDFPTVARWTSSRLSMIRCARWRCRGGCATRWPRPIRRWWAGFQRTRPTPKRRWNRSGVSQTGRAGGGEDAGLDGFFQSDESL